MENSNEFSFYGRCDDQVYGPSDFDYHYWNAPQIPSFESDITDFVQPNFFEESVTYDVPPVTTYGGSYLSDFQEYDDVYNTAYYLQPNYIPLIPSQYHLYCIYQPVYYVYTPVYQEYYAPSHFYIPTPPYDDSDSSYVDTSPFFENEVLPPFVEEYVDAYEEFNSSLQNIGNGVTNDMYGSMEELVGEEITSCHISYAEYPEIMNDAVVANEEERISSDKRVENGTVSSVPGVNGSKAVQLTDDRDSSGSVGTNFRVEGADENFMEKAPSIHMLEGKGDTSKSIYSVYFKNDEREKSLDLKEYYFNDCLRFPKAPVRYEEESEKNILYVLLASLKMSILKQYMEENYNKKKKKLYRRACKGNRKTKKKLKDLKWRRHRLGSIREDEEPEAVSAEMEGDQTLKNDVRHFGLKGDSKNNDVPDVDEQSPVATTSLCDKLQVASVEERVLMVETQHSAVSSGAAENNSKDLGPKKTELSSTKEDVNGGSVIRVGDVEIRYTPDKYRYFCLKKSRETRWTPVRKFFSRMWRYVKKPT